MLLCGKQINNDGPPQTSLVPKLKNVIKTPPLVRHMRTSEQYKASEI
jgi:hypothetical protein